MGQTSVFTTVDIKLSLSWFINAHSCVYFKSVKVRPYVTVARKVVRFGVIFMFILNLSVCVFCFKYGLLLAPLQL
jgi:hypothetical protein